MDLEIENIRAKFREFTARSTPREASSLTQIDIAKLLSVIVERLEDSTDVDNLVSMLDSDLIARIALLVLLTCNPNHANPVGDSDPNGVIEIHEISWELFTRMASATSSQVSSRWNFGRVVFRKQNSNLLLGSQGTKNSRHLWKFDILDSSAAFAEIPEPYCPRFMTAFFYLLLSDLSGSFSRGQVDAIEIPCFLEMFACSGTNNANKIGALLGEYLALVQVCLREDFKHPEYTAKSETEKFDFSILQNGREIYSYSVKSVCFSGTKYFDGAGRNSEPAGRNKTKEIKLLSGEGEVNILLHDCNCDFCEKNSVWKIRVANKVSDDVSDDEDSKSESHRSQRVDEGLEDYGCIWKRDFSATIKKLRFGVVYLVSAPTFFDLRHAVETIDQADLRGVKYPLRDNLCGALAQITTGMRTSATPANAVIRTLISRID